MSLSLLCVVMLAFSSLPQMITSIEHDTNHSGPTHVPICLRHVTSSSVYRPKPVPGKNPSTSKLTGSEEEFVAVKKLRAEFVKVLCSRRSTEVPLSVKPTKPSTNPVCQSAVSPQFRESMASSPKANIKNLKELLQEENLYLTTEVDHDVAGEGVRRPKGTRKGQGEQGRVPVLIISIKDKQHKHKTRPAVVFLHGTGQCKESLRPLLEAYASRGYISIAIDSRYHGERASSNSTYQDVWDLIKLADYLTEKKDIDPTRIGITGISLGEARIDLRKSVIDKEVVKKVWDRIAPGLASRFDSPYTIPAIAPRPLLILNGADDPLCPLPGLEVPVSRARDAYGNRHLLDNFKFIAQPGIGHQLTPQMVKEASDWFDKFLMR
ncbi:hypothetical protein TIFTF001_012787 [Ficus carica]|uniref:Serine aminopeptidase S33 domain-containing protein n=1 Tax=Ficus carica TaxID=3494 RepID=A0AA88ACY6_FICCA|nr:hypothetical protein TIFTF001_012787 [Ficus carica]